MKLNIKRVNHKEHEDHKEGIKNELIKIRRLNKITLTTDRRRLNKNLNLCSLIGDWSPINRFFNFNCLCALCEPH